MTNPNTVEIVVIADRSGSMKPLVSDTIGAFNAFVEEQKALPGSARLTLVTFDNFYEVAKGYESVDIKDAPELTEDVYYARGMTALYDAMGTTLTSLLKQNPARAIVMVITDGEENSSREYNHRQVKELVEQAEAKGWEVIFTAANIDVASYGNSLGIAASATRSFVADSHGIAQAYTNFSTATASYRCAPIGTLKDKE